MCVMLKEDISSTTDNADFVPRDLFHCWIFNYGNMPATLANTFLFILQGSALADLRYGGRFYSTRCRS